MIEKPHITELDAATTAYVHLQVPRAKMPEVFGPAVEELVSTITGQGIEIAGPLFAHHLEMRADEFTFEVGFPVSAPVAAAGRVQPGERPALKVARAVYQGPYEGLPDAWGEFHSWVEQSGLDWAPDIWECYLAGPESGTDSRQWRTELNRPLSR